MVSGVFLIGLVVIVAVLAAVVIMWAVRRNRVVSFDRDRYPGLATLRRSTMTARYIGLAAAVVGFGLVAAWGRLGRGWFLAPAAAGAVLIVAVMIGQQVAYGGARTVGVAAVERRLIRNYLPRGSALAVALCLAMLVAASIWTTVSASPDSLATQRAFTVTGSARVGSEAAPGTQVITSTSTPFPGSFYTIPIAIGVPIVLLLGGIALWLTARRPRNGADPELVAVDDALRRQTAQGVVAGVGLVMSLSLLLVAFLAALALLGAAEFGAGYVVGGTVFGLMALGSLIVAAWSTVLVLVPGTRAVKPA